MINQIIETWFINNRVNLMLLDAISEEGMECTLSKRRGRNVALQFAHLHNVRLYRFERYAKDMLIGQEKIDPKATFDRELLKIRLIESADAMAEWIRNTADPETGKIKGFKRGVIAMLGYYINHDAHHRGSILLTLKENGHAVPKDIRNGIWAWNKI